MANKNVEYRGYLIEDHYPMPSGWIWFNPNNPDVEYGDGTLQECKTQIDEFLEEKENDQH